MQELGQERELLLVLVQGRELLLGQGLLVLQLRLWRRLRIGLLLLRIGRAWVGFG